MRIKTKILTSLFLFTTLLCQGCGDSGCEYTAPAGTVITFAYRVERSGCQNIRCPDIRYVDRTANSQGLVTYGPDEDGNCYPSAKLTIVGRRFPPIGFRSAQSVNLQSYPSKVTFDSGAGLDASNGMPLVQIYDDQGIGTEPKTATDMGDGWLTVDTPNMAGGYSGNYRVAISNRRSDGGYEQVGEAWMSTYGNDPVDSDGDGYYDHQDCDPWDPNRNVDCSVPCDVSNCAEVDYVNCVCLRV